MKPGDLVRYIANPPSKPPETRVIPPNDRPIGLVVEVKTKLIGTDKAGQAVLELVFVKWAVDSWNNEPGGVSEEYRGDLEVVQSG